MWYGAPAGLRFLVVAVCTAASVPVLAQYYTPMPSIPLPRPSPVYSQLTRELIAQNQTLDRIGPQSPSPQQRAGVARIRAGRASLKFAETPGFSITAHLLSLVPQGRTSDPLRALIRDQALPMRTAYQQAMRSGGLDPHDVVDVLAYAYRIAFRIEVGRDPPARYVADNAAVIRQRLMTSAGFQGLPDLERQKLVEEIGIRAAYADAQARIGSAQALSAAHQQAQVILASIYGAAPTQPFLESIASGQ